MSLGRAVRMSWHGGASISLDLAGLQVLIDPAFSRPGDYPPWFTEEHVNLHSPTAEAFSNRFRPKYVFISHGHFDHFDLETVKSLAKLLPKGLMFVGSREVRSTCRDILGVGEERLPGFPRGDRGQRDNWLVLRQAAPGVRVRPVPGRHWFTGDEGDRVAAKFAGREDRYGAMPCGGPMLGFVFEVSEMCSASRSFRVYFTADTDLEDLEEGPFDVAVVGCGGSLVNPVTKLVEPPWMTEDGLAGAACGRLRPRLLVPIHYDHPVFKTPFDPDALAERIRRFARRPDPREASRRAPPTLLVPAYNTWLHLGVP